MKKNTLLYALLVFLVLVNGFFLFNYLGNASHKERGVEKGNFIVRELNFNEAQKEKLVELEKQHLDRIHQILEGTKGLKDELFSDISKEHIDASKIDSIANLIGEIESRKELETFYHFRAIQDICNEEQKVAFAEIVKEALHRKSRRGPNSGPQKDGPKRDGPPPPRH